MKDIIECLVDGVINPITRKGGWAWVTKSGDCDLGGEDDTTENKMEIVATLNAIKNLYDPSKPLKVISHSQYLVNSLTIWLEKRRKLDWYLNKGKTKSASNRDLFIKIDEFIKDKNISFEWVSFIEGGDMMANVNGLANEGALFNKKEVESINNWIKTRKYKKRTELHLNNHPDF